MNALRALRTCLLAALALAAGHAAAQQSERYGPYELHYMVLTSTFITPEIAAHYGITRGRDRALINLSLQEHLPDGTTVARPMELKGRTWDLTQASTELEFREVRENPAIYYIAEFRFFNEEWRHFEVYFRPEGTGETLTLKIRQQMYEDLE